MVQLALAIGTQTVSRYGRRAMFARVELRAGSVPVECDPPLSLEVVDRTRRTNCARYTNCLDHACGAGWAAWDCRSCPVREVAGFGHDEIDGMAALLREVAGPEAVRLRNGWFWAPGMAGARRARK